MLVNLRRVITRPLTIFGIVCMAALLVFNGPTSMYYYLSLAQLIFVPVIVEQLVSLTFWQKFVVAMGQLAVTTLYFTQQDTLILLCVLAYLVSTLIIASHGVSRFLKRGFVNTAETMIDLGLVYIVMGGLWFLAYHLQLNTGFSPIITWLTAIHFHYSAFILCITVGLLGRLHMTRYYKLCCTIIALGPLFVALGITFSTIIEIISVSLYVLAIFSICWFVMKWPLPRLQGLFIRLAFLTLCFTIIWSFLYAYSNLTGTILVDIPDMLNFHGLLNCLGFGIAIVISWSLAIPSTKQRDYTFPVSKIRGKFTPTNKPSPGLVDDMEFYINKETIPVLISEFYERTNQFELTASVKWATWFKPLAFVYQFISRKIGQLNLPFSSDSIMMDGEIWQVDESVDSRSKPRVWQRSIKGDPVFNAIYSQHSGGKRPFMNIALPLPFSTMHGILQLSTKERTLYLTSDGQGDAGTYLAIGSYVFKLPLQEYFLIKEEQGLLIATHDMKLFGLKFLHIDYTIRKK